MNPTDNEAVDPIGAVTTQLAEESITRKTYKLASPRTIAGMPPVPRYDSDGRRCQTGVKPKFVLEEDYDALRQWAIEQEQRCRSKLKT